MDTLTIILTILSSSTFTALVTMAINRVLSNKRKKDIQIKALQLLLRGTLINDYYNAKANCIVSIEQAQTFNDMYEVYHNMGKNGVLDRMHNEYQSISIAKGD